jgi:ferredoxin-NADP reductase
MDLTDVAVETVRTVGPDAIALELRTPDGFTARPGQFVKLSAEIDGESISRFYTISSPRVTDNFETTLTVDPMGTFGPYLADLEEGETVRVAGPFGNSYYEGEDTTLVIAGGPGVGPAVGIGERTLEDGGETAIVYFDDRPIHENRLETLSVMGGEVFIIDSPDALAPAVEETLSEDTDENAQVFVYGFSPFLDVATEAISAAGGNAEAAKLENFGPAPDK